mgnify:CR=1 FL=1
MGFSDRGAFPIPVGDRDIAPNLARFVNKSFLVEIIN